jgi:hypothetical protein
MNTKSYSDLSDSATTFDPEEQFDRDIDERMKGMSKEEAVARAMARTHWTDYSRWLKYLPAACAAIAAADKWDAEQRQPAISAGQDAAIQDELDHPTSAIMKD